jgi:predicted N-acetyltransferase YhbS
MIFIREENAEDIEKIGIINELAFGQQAEANMVDRLRKNCPDLALLSRPCGR